jgi:hypothetical protein
VAALQPQSVELRRRLLKSERDSFSAFQGAAKIVAEFPWPRYELACSAVGAAQAKFARSAEASFSEDKSTGVLGDSWRAFIQAGDTYWQERHGAQGHPKEGDLYCDQELTTTAAALLEKYIDYCRSTDKQDLDRAIAEQKHLARPLAELNSGALDRSAKEKQQPGNSAGNEKVLADAVLLAAGIATAQREIGAGNVPDSADLIKLAREHGAALAAAIRALDDEDAVLKAQATEREKVARTKTEQLRTLENRLALRSLIAGIRTYVDQAKWVSLAGTVGQRFTAVLRSLTEESKFVSEQLLNQDFEKRSLLRARQWWRLLPGPRGQAARKSLVADHRLSETLSEGEQKAIAFADFLAEAGLLRGAAPLVLDDPVNSLDYKRVREVVDRVVTLAETRQVIVFTHNILFATGLIGKYDDSKRKANCTFYNVIEEDGVVGKIAAGTHPRWDSEAQLKKRVDKLVEEAGKATGEERTAKIEYAYGVMRSWCEVFFEQELLKAASQRYQANVMMTKRGYRVDRLEARKGYRSALSRRAMMPDHCSRSRPRVRPKIEELKEDWKRASDARGAYMA